LTSDRYKTPRHARPYRPSSWTTRFSRRRRGAACSRPEA
jgi:hypothetical protein